MGWFAFWHERTPLMPTGFGSWILHPAKPLDVLHENFNSMWSWPKLYSGGSDRHGFTTQNMCWCLPYLRRSNGTQFDGCFFNLALKPPTTRRSSYIPLSFDSQAVLGFRKSVSTVFLVSRFQVHSLGLVHPCPDQTTRWQSIVCEPMCWFMKSEFRKLPTPGVVPWELPSWSCWVTKW